MGMAGHKLFRVEVQPPATLQTPFQSTCSLHAQTPANPQAQAHSLSVNTMQHDNRCAPSNTGGSKECSAFPVHDCPHPACPWLPWQPRAQTSRGATNQWGEPTGNSAPGGCLALGDVSNHGLQLVLVSGEAIDALLQLLHCHQVGVVQLVELRSRAGWGGAGVCGSEVCDSSSAEVRVRGNKPNHLPLTEIKVSCIPAAPLLHSLLASRCGDLNCKARPRQHPLNPLTFPPSYPHRQNP